jgi:hypothetical protein
LINQKEKNILRQLARELAEIAYKPENDEKKLLWRKLNDLEQARPMVWINEIPWHEMNYEDELTLTTENEFARKQEIYLRELLYKWKHMPCDMIVEPKISCPLVIEDSGFGIKEDVDIVKTDNQNSVVSRHFNIQIKEEKDVEKIKNPVVYYNKEATEKNFEMLEDIYHGILPVQKEGARGFWFAPWDELIRWMGVEETLINIYEDPDLIHSAINRLVDAYLSRLDQYENLGLLSSNNSCVRIGSGGFGYTDNLQKESSNLKCTPDMLWGSAAAQIFGSVSPATHEEFALQYELKWLSRFGLNYYGCCDPLHNKINIIEKIPNLRKFSVSPWSNLKKVAEETKGKYVLSCKPNPSIFASDNWDIDKAKEDILSLLQDSQGCNIEIILKDISTVRYEPQRLWEWASMVMDIVK